MITRLLLFPPLAIARVGGSPVPCANFHWAESDLSPTGSGKTTVQPAETLTVDPDTGEISAATPAEMIFRDADGIRPVCPFFELHGEWEENGEVKPRPLTEAVLERFGLSLGDVSWTLELANLKAHHYTLNDSDRIQAVETIRGDDATPRPLFGTSPIDAANPLVLPRTDVAADANRLRLGTAQVVKPTAAFGELRLRFTPPPGLIYGPRNLSQRIAGLQPFEANSEWAQFSLPAGRLILNENAAWSQFSLAVLDQTGQARFNDDFRTSPGFLFGWVHEPPQLFASLGLSDDMSDGILHCRIGDLEAVARIAVGPPDFAPDRRHVVSLADGLADREERAAVRDPAFFDDAAAVTEIVQDLMERAFETAGLMNIDAQNDRSIGTNLGQWDPTTSPFTRQQVLDMLWPQDGAGELGPLPIAARGQRRHRRNSALEVFEDRLRENPDLLDQWMRPPLYPSPFFDRRMPPVMRGSDGRPFHLTRRQYELLRGWAARLRTEAEQGS